MTGRHRRLAEALGEPVIPRIVDLDCGEGDTLRALRERFGPSVELVGVERKAVELAVPDARLVVADLNKPLPFEDASFGAAVCHNTLEALPSADSFVSEVWRVLAPGAHFLLGHTDLDTLVFHASDLDLTRRFVHAYADTQEEWMDAADGTIGRKLPAIARHSLFELVATQAWVDDLRVHAGLGEFLFSVNDYAVLLRRG